jgi:hypothetical protein
MLLFSVSVPECGGIILRALSRKVAGSSPRDVIRFLQLTKSFQSHYGPGVDSASNRNEYQATSWGLKVSRLTVICELIV